MNVAAWSAAAADWAPLARKLRRDPLAWFSLTVIALLVLSALAAPWLTSRPAEGQGEPNPPAKLLPPSAEHPLGTDHLGRDLWARVLFGGQISLALGGLVVASAVLIGVPLGAVAGYYGGWVDEAIMRATDVFLAFPPLLLAIAISSALGASFGNAVLAIAITWWPWYTRLVRAQAVALRERPYVEAARVIGVDDLTILLRHILPNTLTPVIVQATLDLGAAILTGAALSFLGLGVQPPAADWGQLISLGRVFFPDHWWYATFPGLAILLAGLGFTLLGDSLRDALD